MPPPLECIHPMLGNEQHLSVYIDLEAISSWVRRVDAQLPWEHLSQFLDHYGSTHVVRVYGGKQTLAEHRIQLASPGISQVQLPGEGADPAALRSYMTLDAMQDLFLQPLLDQFVLVGLSDCPTLLVERLQSFGKRVLGIAATDNMPPEEFPSCYDDFVPLHQAFQMNADSAAGQTDGRHSLSETAQERSDEATALSATPLNDSRFARPIWQDILQLPLPSSPTTQSSAAQAADSALKARRRQQYDLAGHQFLLACRLLWDAVEGEPDGDALRLLRWYMASYASLKAGQLLKHQEIQTARAYYLAFFDLVRNEETYRRVDGLIRPMLTYYWGSVFREFDLPIPSGSRNRMLLPADIGHRLLRSSNPQVRQRWRELTQQLAMVNRPLLAQVVAEMKQQALP